MAAIEDSTVQTNKTDADDMNRDEAAPPELNTIPKSVIEAMRLVMKEAQKAASDQLENAKAALKRDRTAFEGQKAKLENELTETKAALEAEKASHHRTIESSESLRVAAQQHEEIVHRLTKERDQARALNQGLESDKSELQKDHQSKGTELRQLNAQLVELKQQLEDLELKKSQLETETTRLSDKDVKATQENARLTAENRKLTAELMMANEALSNTEKRRQDTVDRFKKVQIEIFNLKAEVGEKVSELKRLKRAALPSAASQD